MQKLLARFFHLVEPFVPTHPNLVLRSWTSFFDPGQFSHPLQKADATNRIRTNFRFWAANYFALSLVTLLLLCLWRVQLFAWFLITAATHVGMVAYPIILMGDHTLTQQEKYVCLFFVSFGVLYILDKEEAILAWIFISGFLCLWHASFRKKTLDSILDQAISARTSVFENVLRVAADVVGDSIGTANTAPAPDPDIQEFLCIPEEPGLIAPVNAGIKQRPPSPPAAVAQPAPVEPPVEILLDFPKKRVVKKIVRRVVKKAPGQKAPV